MSSAGRRGRVTTWIAATVAVALVAGVLAAAGPQQVWGLLRSTNARRLAEAAGLAGLAVIFRGLRLYFALPPGRLSLLYSPVLAAAAQAANLFIPARLGELVLPWLLRRTCGLEAASGVGTLLAVRTLDLAALGAWAVGGIALMWGLDQPLALAASVVLLAPLLLLPAIMTTADRMALRLLAPHGRRGRRWTRRVRRARRAIVDVQQRPARLTAAAAAALAMWGAVWLFTWRLLRAMAFDWPLSQVIAGSAFATLANLLPVNLVANLGTLEAGWTAAFTALGHPLRDAAASGLAAHLWALAFTAAFGLPAWLVVLRTPQRHP